MVGRLFGGTGRQRDKYYDIVPDNEEMAIWAQNASDQFLDPGLSPLNSQDAMERYMRQVAKTSTPEIRIPQEDDKVLEGRKKAHLLINRLANGGPRGSSDLAYKPELTQSNVSTYTYAVPATDPIIASYGNDLSYNKSNDPSGRMRNSHGSYHSDTNGNTIYRERLPNRQTNAELSVRMFNTQNRIAKYAAAVNRVENTSQIVDFVPQRKDATWGDRALDTIRHRLMPRITMEDNGDNFNREKNKCRDTNKIAFKYRHKEYDTNVELHEVLDGNMRTMPEIGPTEGDGTPIGNLVAELAKDGKAYAYLDNDIYIDQIGIKARQAANGNRNLHTEKRVFAEEFPDVEEEDGMRDSRTDVKNKTIRNNIFNGLDPIKKAIVAGEMVEEIIRESKKAPTLRARRKDIPKHSTFAEDLPMDIESDSGVTDQRHIDNKDEDMPRKILQVQIPTLRDMDIHLTEMRNIMPKMKSKSQQRGVNTRDDGFGIIDEEDGEHGRTATTLESVQGLRSLIKDLVPDSEFTKPRDRMNPNRKNFYKGGKIIKHGVSYSTLFDKPNDEDLTNGNKEFTSRQAKRPQAPDGIRIEPQLEFEGKNRKPNIKRKKPSIRDFRL